MNAMSRNQLESLVRLEGSPCVSVYMPLAGGGPLTASRVASQIPQVVRATLRGLG